MLPSLSRETVQFLSILLFGTGAIVLIVGDANIAAVRATGIVLCAFAIWFVMMSESVFLSKVQAQMHEALDALSVKREGEVQELLSFLKGAKLASSPMESADATAIFINDLPYPAFVMTPMMGILKANIHLTNLLGWESGALDGRPVMDINDKTVMSAVGAITSSARHIDKKELSLRYVYLHKDTTRIYGNLHVIKLPDGSFFMVFHPDADNVVTDDDLAKLLAPRD